MSELTSFNALEMAALVRARKVSSRELVDAHLDRIEKLNPTLNAFACLDAAGAREQARATEAEATRGGGGALLGIPITIKSSIDVAGFQCECGSRLRQGRIPKQDAALVARLRSAGAVILGVTNVPEFLTAYETDNLLHGRTNNPWDLARTPGGSSGGEAAAIAACCSAAGIGSDGGGSIRVPAHFCGICGLKPTPGRIPTTGHFPACIGPAAFLGVVGPLARRVADLQLLFEVAAGHDWYDPASATVPFRKPAPEQVKKLRVGYYEDDGFTPVTAETRAAVHSAVAALQEQGIAVEPFQAAGLEKSRRAWWTLFGESGAVLLESLVDGRMEDVHPFTKELLAAAESARAGGFDKLLEAWVDRDLMRARLLKQMEERPLLLCPVASIPAFRHGERSWMVEGAKMDYPQAFRYCQVFNLLGNPVAVVPAGRSPEGLPIGVQIVGRPWEDEVVLAVAARVEEALGPWQAPPLA